MPARDMKSWTVDPMAFLETSTHRERYGVLSFDQLKAMAYRCDVIAAIIGTRVSQVASFCEPQRDRHSFGFGIALRDTQKSGSAAAQKQAMEIATFLQNGGLPGFGKDNFETFLRKFVRDSLIYDAACFEIIPRQNGLPAFFEAVDAATIRLAVDSKPEVGDEGTSKEVPYGTAFQRAKEQSQKIVMIQRGKEEIPAKYIQLVAGAVRTVYTEDEFYYGIRNPRTDMMVGGYGMSEMETLIGVITSYLWAEEYNRKIFSQGSIPKGILNIKGEITEQQMTSFRREWTNLVSGVQNSWKTPLINAEDIEYINLQSSNKDMEYMQWIQFLLRIASACYQIDPAEINFDMPRGLEQSNPMVETSGEAKLRASRDRGLQPLLRFVTRSINQAIVHKLDPDFEFQFLGLDGKSVDQQLTHSVQSLSSFKTLNEVRAENDLEAVEGGDTVLNPSYLNLLAQQQQAQAQEQMIKLAKEDPKAALISQGIDPEPDDHNNPSAKKKPKKKSKVKKSLSLIKYNLMNSSKTNESVEVEEEILQKAITPSPLALDAGNIVRKVKLLKTQNADILTDKSRLERELMEARNSTLKAVETLSTVLSRPMEIPVVNVTLEAPKPNVQKSISFKRTESGELVAAEITETEKKDEVSASEG